MQGLSLGPADLAANRRMKTTRVGGGHPGYLVRARPDRRPTPTRPRATYQQDLWHYTIARMVDACVTYGILPFYGPFGDIDDIVACEDQFRNAYLLGCVGAWSLHPAQIEIAKRVFSPRPDRRRPRPAGHRGDGRRHRRGDARREDGGRRLGQAVPGRSSRSPSSSPPATPSSPRLRVRVDERRADDCGRAAPCSTCRRPTSGRSRRPRRSRATRSSSTSRTPSRPTPSRLARDAGRRRRRRRASTATAS